MKATSIPYGYRIERGKAVINELEAEKVRELFSFYLSGLSIKKAKEAAGIDTCVRTANNMLQKETYLGDDYYPAIIERATFNAAAEERLRRLESFGNRRPKKPKDVIEIKTRFRIADTNVIPADLTPAQKVSFLYSLIVAYPNGTETIAASDRSKLHKLLQ